MKINWRELEVEALRTLYEKESAALKTALLNGSTWEEVQELRKKVTDLSIALHKKIQASAASDNPAETADRGEKRIQR